MNILVVPSTVSLYEMGYKQNERESVYVYGTCNAKYIPSYVNTTVLLYHDIYMQRV